ncbi:MAG: methyltransferase domain-containing protein [Tepidisphaeraceae bacterium]|jgi:ubiquinone/menaquinone biosynthesis C-methylase UbiE
MSKPKIAAGRTDWSHVAPWYDQIIGEAGGEYHRHVVIPGVLRLLVLTAGQRVIDIACGQGVLCRALAQRAVEVTGIDASQAMIDAARERGPEVIRYQVAQAGSAEGLPGGYFHSAACVLAIQNIHPLPPVFATVARLLAPGGKFVLAMTHPCFRGAKETSWGWDEQRKIQYRRVDRYLLPRKTPIVTHPGSAPEEYTWTFHRPMEDYVNAAARAGLMIDAMEEWPSHKHSDSGPRAAAENTARKEIPMFLALRAVKAPLAQA